MKKTYNVISVLSFIIFAGAVAYLLHSLLNVNTSSIQAAKYIIEMEKARR